MATSVNIPFCHLTKRRFVDALSMHFAAAKQRHLGQTGKLSIALVFHCHFSQCRGPKAAARVAAWCNEASQQLKTVQPIGAFLAQFDVEAVSVLEGGIQRWTEAFGGDARWQNVLWELL